MGDVPALPPIVQKWGQNIQRYEYLLVMSLEKKSLEGSDHVMEQRYRVPVHTASHKSRAGIRHCVPAPFSIINDCFNPK